MNDLNNIQQNFNLSPSKILRGDKFEVLKVLWGVDKGQLKRLISRHNYLIEDVTDLENFADIMDENKISLIALATSFKLPINYVEVVEKSFNLKI